MPGAEDGGRQQPKGEAESPPPSSFPVSSPSFWAEAASITLPATTGTPVPTSAKRALPPSSSPDPFDASRHDLISPPPKRARRSSGSPDPDSPSRTTLTFLPNPQSIRSSTDPHAYLAGDEYAPNKFGDIGDYMRKKEIKIQAQNASIAGPSAGTEYPQIFAGMSFHINGNTHPPMEQLRKIILQRGGVCYPVLRNKGMVDYIIAPVLTMKKHKEFASYKVVREAWVVDSAKEGKLLDWKKWRLIVEEGWEAGSRKGMEGFFGGKGKAAPGEMVVVEEEEAEQEVKKPEKPDIPVITTQNESIITTPTKQRLLTPHRPIPISPGQHPPPSTTPTGPPPVRLPPKVQQPEGAWEHYYTKTSNEHAQKAMQSDEWRARNTAERGNDGGFIDGYYQNSRLHHLSMWKAELRVLVKDAQKRSEEALAASQEAEEEQAGEKEAGQHSLARAVLPSLPLPAAPSTSSEKVIFHVDFDAFFVSCGLASRPHLRGKPTVVCHSTGKAVAGSTSEIASCSYEARAKGVKNGMSLGRARELVGEELQTMPYEFETYKKFSLAFYTILMGYADDLQAVSVDEALIDVTAQVAARAALPEETGDQGAEGADGAMKKRDPAVELAEKIRDDVRKVTDGCEVSIGISHNILLAKLATRHAKPAGVFHMLPSAMPSFLAPLDVADFPSVGHSTKSKIQSAFGTTTVGDLLGVSKGRWKGVLGEKTGDMVWGYCRGLDSRKLEGDKERKSVSAEMNYGIRFKNQEQAEKYVVDLAAEVTKRMKNVGVKGRTVTLKLMRRHPDAPIEPPKFMGHGWCETFNRSAPLLARGASTDDPSVLADESLKLLRALCIDPVELRGVGIQVTKLDSGDDKPSGEKDRPAGQGVLQFTARPKPVAHSIPAEAGPSRPRGQLPVAPGSDGGSSSGIEEIDPEYLAALPSSLRSEVKRDHALMRSPSRGRSRAISPPKEVQEVIPVSSSPPIPVSPEAISPTKGTGKASGTHEAAHIARQLRPKGKTQMRAGAIASGPLFGAWAKVDREKSTSVDRTVVVDVDASPSADVVDLTADGDPDGDPEIIPGYTHSHLRTLGIDPSVLLALPPRMQKEVIAQEERNAAMRRALYVPGDRSREGTARMSASLSPVKAAALAQARGRSVSRSVPPVAAVGRVVRPAKPALMGSTEVPDVLDTITLWVESRKGGPPAGRDAGKVGGYLKKCVEGGMGGVERAAEVLRWMRVLLREKWGSDEEPKGGEEGSAEEAGKVWWRTWREMRDEVVAASEQRFGAGLKI
ncbi:hypothetical protein IAT38_004493 [Cryptococcus sp. DSM 104549]